MNEQPYRLRLYVSGRADNASRAAADVRRLCEKLFTREAWQLDVLDVRDYPDMAEEDKILATPTLIRKAPPPQRRLIGEFRDGDAVLAALGIEKDVPAGKASAGQ